MTQVIYDDMEIGEALETLATWHVLSVRTEHTFSISHVMHYIHVSNV